MKKFSEWVQLVREAEVNEQSELQKSYQEYFKGKLKKFGVESPADLDDEKKKEFFSEISADWEKGKGVKEAEEIADKIEDETKGDEIKDDAVEDKEKSSKETEVEKAEEEEK